MEKYPDRIYEVREDGWLGVFVLSGHLPSDFKWNGAVCMPYVEYPMLEYRSDDGWKLRDYESEIGAQKKLPYLCTLSLDYIDDRLHASGDNGSATIWVTDLEEALSVSKERYERHFPTGKSYDVVKYMDGYETCVMNDGPLLYSEAVELKKSYDKNRKPYWSYEIKVRRD